MLRFVVHILVVIPNALMLVAFSVFQGWYDTGAIRLSDWGLVSMAVAGAGVTLIASWLDDHLIGHIGRRPMNFWWHLARWTVMNIVILDVAYGIATFIIFVLSPAVAFSLIQAILVSTVMMLVYLLMIAPFGVISGVLTGAITYAGRRSLYSSGVAKMAEAGAPDWAA